MKHSVVPRLIGLVVVVVLGTYYIVFSILGVGFGGRGFDVRVMLPRAAGVYAGADVTYRGVSIGKVTKLQVESNGVEVTLRLNHGAKVPANSTASVRQLSALGEQYLDLVPTGSTGRSLRSGDLIPQQRTTVPTAVSTTLLDLGTFLDSLDQNDVATVESFLTTGFVDTGPALKTLVVTGQELARALIAARQGTSDLIIDANPVLKNALATNADLARFAAGLASFTGQLRASNDDLRGVLVNAGSSATDLSHLLDSTSAALQADLKGLATGAQLSTTYQPQLAAMFALLPVVAGELNAATKGGVLHGALAINGLNTVCSYLPSSRIPGPTTTVPTTALTNSCPTHASDLLQRGADTAPRPAGG